MRRSPWAVSLCLSLYRLIYWQSYLWADRAVLEYLFSESRALQGVCQVSSSHHSSNNGPNYQNGGAGWHCGHHTLQPSCERPPSAWSVPGKPHDAKPLCMNSDRLNVPGLHCTGRSSCPRLSIAVRQVLHVLMHFGAVDATKLCNKSNSLLAPWWHGVTQFIFPEYCPLASAQSAAQAARVILGSTTISSAAVLIKQPAATCMSGPSAQTAHERRAQELLPAYLATMQ